MSSVMEWLGFKTAKQRALEAKRYDKWAFPYGQAQKEKVTQILRELLPEEKPKMAMLVYLQGKQGYTGGNAAQGKPQRDCSDEKRVYYAQWAMETTLRGKLRKRMPRYLALIIADQQVDASLEYPSAEQLTQMAEELDKQYKIV